MCTDWSFDGVVQWNLRMLIYFSVLVPEECLLIVQCESHLKSKTGLSDLYWTWRVFIDSLMVLCNETKDC